MYFSENHDQVYALFEAYEPGRKLYEAWISANESIPGYCVVCDRIVSFRNERHGDTGWVNLRAQMKCVGCGMTARMRSFIHGVKISLAGPSFKRGLVFERVTSMFRILAGMLPGIEGCEYLGSELAPGAKLVTESTRHRLGDVPVRHEDMQSLSFPKSSLDYVLHSDVLEHVPDPYQGLRECSRVLRSGGVMLFACPVYAVPDTKKIAELRGGKTEFLGNPVFHGDPLNGAGVPVYNNFGFDIFDRVKEAGFSRVEIGFAHDTVAGYFSDANPFRHALMWHVMCRATK